MLDTREFSLDRTAPRDPHVTPGQDAILTTSERDTLVSLAAYHVAYAKPYEALGLLQLANLAHPDHVPTLRLMVEALIQTGDHDSADGLLRQIERLTETPKTHLLRALIELGRNRVDQARATFARALELAGGVFQR